MARGEDMDNIILGLTQRQREKRCAVTINYGDNKNTIHMIATSEDWKHDINGRVA